jgi:hypothetical protein
MPIIEVTPGIMIEQSELAFSFARAGGPGGEPPGRVRAIASLDRGGGEKPEFRVKTRPSLAARERRIETKVRRGKTKRLRGPPVE